MPANKQIQVKWYLDSNYLSPRRMSSVGVQFQLCTKTQTNSFLDIGAGGRLLTWILNQNGKQAWAVDSKLVAGPDITGALPNLPFRNEAVETTLCFQVLEHITYSLLEPSLAELARVSSSYVIISLPDHNQRDGSQNKPDISLERQVKRAIVQTVGKTPFGPQRWRDAVNADTQSKEKIDPHHFWEVNYDGITQEHIIDKAEQAGLQVIEVFNNVLLPYHLFFYFKKL